MCKEKIQYLSKDEDVLFLSRTGLGNIYQDVTPKLDQVV